MVDVRDVRGGQAHVQEFLDGNDLYSTKNKVVTFKDHILSVFENLEHMNSTIDNMTSSGINFDEIEEVTNGNTFREPVARMFDDELNDMSTRDIRRITSRQAVTGIQTMEDSQIGNNVALVRNARLRHLMEYNKYNPQFPNSGLPEPPRAKTTPDSAVERKESALADERSRRESIINSSGGNI